MIELLSTIPSVALAVYAHPDDAEVSCGGTLALWARAGCQVHILVVTCGDKGSRDPKDSPESLAVRREGEMKEASAALGISGRILLGYLDGEIENTVDLRCDIVRCVRDLKPDVVICPDPTATFFGQEYVNHHDHRAVGWAALDAVAPAAAMPHYFPDTGAPHQVATVYLSGTLEPDIAVEISATLGDKIAALQCHATQVGGSGEWVEELVRVRAADAGQMAGVFEAEAFRCQRLGP